MSVEKTIVQKHTRTDWTSALKEEIQILRDMPTEKKTGMNVETFNPMSEEACFMGQMLNQCINSIEAERHRQIVGLVNTGEVPFRRNSMTPLEVWSAELWGAGNKEPVLHVFLYIKGEKEDLPYIQMN